jgi:hypothetical protein
LNIPQRRGKTIRPSQIGLARRLLNFAARPEKHPDATNHK